MKNPIIRDDGAQEWRDNSRHGPSIIYSIGTKLYYEYSMHHRIGGPAIIWSDGNKSYWINGKQVTKLEHDLLCDMMKLKGLLINI
jgi:hypothetical protein